jgi:pullulanase/glycogen debranching enzyme
MVARDVFDWGDEEPHPFRPSEAIIYELHVRGLTAVVLDMVVNHTAEGNERGAGVCVPRH